MKQKRRYQPRKTDSNHQQVMEILRRGGWKVRSAHEMGRGFPDLVAALKGLTILVEVKDGARSPSSRRLTRDQIKFMASWPGQAIIALTGLDALGQCNAILRLSQEQRMALIKRRQERYLRQELELRGQ